MAVLVAELPTGEGCLFHAVCEEDGESWAHASNRSHSLPYDLARMMQIAWPSLSQNATYVRRLRCGDVAGDDVEDTADRAHAGDAERRDAGLRVAVEVSNVPFDQEGLSGVRASPRRRRA